VILVCQCQTARAENEFAQIMCSSIQSSGTVRTEGFVFSDNTRWRPTVVDSFHPMYCVYREDSPTVYRKRRQQLEDSFGLALDLLGVPGTKIETDLSLNMA